MTNNVSLGAKAYIETQRLVTRLTTALAMCAAMSCGAGNGDDTRDNAPVADGSGGKAGGDDGGSNLDTSDDTATALADAAALGDDSANDGEVPSIETTIPKHVKNWLSYGGYGFNQTIPAAYMAEHAEYTISMPKETVLIGAFKAAGGHNATVKTDPSYVDGCTLPAGPGGKCTAPLGDMMAEDAWLHDKSGKRITRNAYGTLFFAPNPASKSMRDAWHTFTQDLASKGVDLFFAHDAGGASVSEVWATVYSTPPVEITTQAQYDEAESAMLAASAKPIYWSQYWIDANKTHGLTMPNVMGTLDQGCYMSKSTAWETVGNQILKVLQSKRSHFCIQIGGGGPVPSYASPQLRLYSYASWLLTYDPDLSVHGVRFGVPPLKDGSAVGIVAEDDIVPRNPLKTAALDITALKTATGAYAREFANCYQASLAIGPCAAVVNPSAAASVAVPVLSATYSKSLVLNDMNQFAGGTATFGGAVPKSLSPSSAAILLQ
ncbi:MAG: hypothetical protein NVSMB1_02270 [Polyangiales bacterium]